MNSNLKLFPPKNSTKFPFNRRLFPNGSYVSWVSFTDGPTIVNVNLYVRSFEKIDDVKMVLFKQTRTFRSQKKKSLKKQEYSVQITFRQQWNDYRLAYNDMNGEREKLIDTTFLEHSRRKLVHKTTLKIYTGKCNP